jgi:multisubunit Na+/H+ antiporter MnhE subunit
MRDRLRRAAGNPTTAEAFIGALVAFAIAALGVHFLGKDHFSVAWVLLLTLASIALAVGVIRLVAGVKR